MKTRPVGAELFHADVRADRQTDMNLIVSFRNFANARKKLASIISLNVIQTVVFVIQKLYVLCKEAEFSGFVASKCQVEAQTNSAITGCGLNDRALISVCRRYFALTATVCPRWLWDSLNPS